MNSDIEFVDEGWEYERSEIEDEEIEEDVLSKAQPVNALLAPMKKVETILFSVLYSMAKDNDMPTTLELALLLIEDMQLISFGLDESFGVHYPDLLLIVFHPLKLIATDYGAFRLTIWCAFLLILMTAACGIYVGYCYGKKDFKHVWPIKLLRNLTAILTTALLIPLIELFMLGVNCNSTTGRLVHFKDVDCYGRQHMIGYLFSVLGLLLFIPFAVIMTFVLFEPMPIPGHHILAKSNGRSDVVFIFLRIIIIVTFEFTYLLHVPALKLCVLFLSLIAAAFMYLNYMPHYSLIITRLRVGFVFAAMFNAISAFLIFLDAVPETYAPASMAVWTVAGFWLGTLIPGAVYKTKSERIYRLIQEKIRIDNEGEPFSGDASKTNTFSGELPDNISHSSRLRSGEINMDTIRLKKPEAAHLIFKSSNDVEIACRFIIVNTSDTARDLMHYIFRQGISQFPKDVLLQINYSYYIRAYDPDSNQNAEQIISRWSKVTNLQFDVRALVFFEERAMEQTHHTAGLEDEEMTIAAYVEYQQLEQSACLHHSLTLQEVRLFWSYLATAAENKDPRVLQVIAQRINASQRPAEKFYGLLLQKFAKSRSVLRLYAMWLSQIKADRAGCNELMNIVNFIESTQPDLQESSERTSISEGSENESKGDDKRKVVTKKVNVPSPLVTIKLQKLDSFVRSASMTATRGNALNSLAKMGSIQAEATGPSDYNRKKFNKSNHPTSVANPRSHFSPQSSSMKLQYSRTIEPAGSDSNFSSDSVTRLSSPPTAITFNNLVDSLPTSFNQPKYPSNLSSGFSGGLKQFATQRQRRLSFSPDLSPEEKEHMDWFPDLSTRRASVSSGSGRRAPIDRRPSLAPSMGRRQSVSSSQSGGGANKEARIRQLRKTAIESDIGRRMLVFVRRIAISMLLAFVAACVLYGVVFQTLDRVASDADKTVTSAKLTFYMIGISRQVNLLRTAALSNNTVVFQRATADLSDLLDSWEFQSIPFLHDHREEQEINQYYFDRLSSGTTEVVWTTGYGIGTEVLRRGNKLIDQPIAIFASIDDANSAFDFFDPRSMMRLVYSLEDATHISEDTLSEDVQTHFGLTAAIAAYVAFNLMYTAFRLVRPLVDQSDREELNILQLFAHLNDHICNKQLEQFNDDAQLFQKTTGKVLREALRAEHLNRDKAFLSQSTTIRLRLAPTILLLMQGILICCFLAPAAVVRTELETLTKMLAGTNHHLHLVEGIMTLAQAVTTNSSMFPAATSQSDRNYMLFKAEYQDTIAGLEAFIGPMHFGHVNGFYDLEGAPLASIDELDKYMLPGLCLASTCDLNIRTLDPVVQSSPGLLYSGLSVLLDAYISAAKILALSPSESCNSTNPNYLLMQSILPDIQGGINLMSDELRLLMSRKSGLAALYLNVLFTIYIVVEFYSAIRIAFLISKRLQELEIIVGLVFTVPAAVVQGTPELRKFIDSEGQSLRPKD